MYVPFKKLFAPSGEGLHDGICPLALSHDFREHLHQRCAVFRFSDAVFCLDPGASACEDADKAAPDHAGDQRDAGLSAAQQHDLCDAGLGGAADAFWKRRPPY